MQLIAEIINFKKQLAKSKLIDKIFYSLGRTTIPTSIVNIAVVGTYLKGGCLPLDHRIKRIGPVNRNWEVLVHDNIVIIYYDIF
jgi:hypothetical protein